MSISIKINISWASLSSLVRIYQLLAELLSLYQLVLSVFVFSLSKDLLNSLSTTDSKVLLSLCPILSLIIFSSFFLNAQMSNLLSTPRLLLLRHVNACMSTSNFLVFVAGEFDRQRYYYID